jgi:oligoendopeptidase F
MSHDYHQEAWSLDNLFPAIQSPEVEDALKDLQQQIQSFADYRPILASDLPEEKFLAILRDYEQGVRKMVRLLGMGHLSFAQDTQDQAAQTFLGRMQQFAAQMDNQTMFFKLWWKGLEDEVAQKFMSAAGDYAYWLEALRLQKPYTLSEAEERIINIKDVNGPQALVNLYDSITNRYLFHLRVDGEEKELTRGELSIYFRHYDADLRQAAYAEQNRVYAADASILGQIYQYRCRDWRGEHVDLRGYLSPIAVRNLGNDIPDEVVDSLLDVCRQNAPLFHRFFNLKAHWLGIDRLRRYDIYAPVAKSDKSYGFNEAVELILESFHQFDPIFADLARKVLDEHHLDSEVRKGKRHGAFCAPMIPELTPWVHTSYQGKSDDVATLAHEMGHAIHALLSSHHTVLTYDACLPLAEVASTFGEILLVENMLAHDPDPTVERDLLFRQMDEAYGTVMRQAYFTMFERSAHELVQSGASTEDLSQAYFGNLKDQFGDSIDLSEDFRTEWLAIPHFYHTPFYVYAYSFGQLLVYSLYQQYRSEGESFKPRYLGILSAGGADAPMRILDTAGVDVRKPEFWQGGLDVLKGTLERLEAMEIAR